MVFGLAIVVLTGAGACMTGAARQGQRSASARRTFGLVFLACAFATLVVGCVSWSTANALSGAITLVAGVILLFGILRWSRALATTR